MEEVLLIGSSIGMLNIAKKIKEKGYKLIVMGSILDDPCHRVADESLFVDYRDVEKSIYACSKLNIKYIVPGSNDIAYNCALKIAEALGIKTFDKHDAIEILHTKLNFRQYLNKLQISQPNRYDIDDIYSPDFQEWPVIVKPNLAFSGKGITVINSVDKLADAISEATQASRDKSYTIEAFVDGDLYSISTFISNQLIIKSIFSKEMCQANQFAVDYSFTPSDLSEGVKKLIEADVNKIIEALELRDGLLHIQLIYNSNTQKFYFIESMRRLIGDFYGRKVEYAYGFDYDEMYLRPFLEEKLEIPTEQTPEEVHRKIVSSSEKFIFENYKPSKGEQLIEIIPLATAGELIEAHPNGKAAIVFFRKGVKND